MSGVYADEGWLEYISSQTDTVVFDFTPFSGTNSYCSPESLGEISHGVRSDKAGYGSQNLYWIDTGDYHYIAGIIAAEIHEPFALALFDNHSDEGDFSDMLSCGNWVSWLESVNPNLKARVRNPEPESPLPDLPLYISVDLDVLSPSSFRTNWDQGTMTPEQLLSSIDALAASHRIIGIDICGGITIAKGATAEALTLNAKLRTQILEHLSKLITNE